MAKEDTPLDQGVFDSTLEAELAKGTDRRVAEGRARARPPCARTAPPTPRRPPRTPPRARRRPPPRPRPQRQLRRHRLRFSGGRLSTGRSRGRRRRDGHLARPRGAAADGEPPDPEEGRARQAPPAGARATRGHPARRAGAGRPREHLAPPPDRGDGGDVHPVGGDDGLPTFINAPLRELANANLTPNPSKAPWYFLGLQELLRYFHPMVAGITIPTFILIGLAAIPYMDRNPSNKPGDRRIALTLFTILFMFGAVLTIIGRSSAAPATTGPGRGHRGCSSNCEHARALHRIWAALFVLLALNLFAIIFGLSFLRRQQGGEGAGRRHRRDPVQAGQGGLSP